MARPTDRPGVRSVLARSGYRRLWAARTVSQGGDVLQFTTVALLVHQLTGSALGVSFVVLAEIAPVLLLAPLAGPLVDRLSRTQVMVGADLLRLVLAAVLALAHDDVVVVYALAFGLSAGSVFFNPAAGSLLPTLVGDDELVAANSGIWSAAVLVQVALAPLAGLLAVTAGFGWAFAINAASFGLSALFLRGLRATEAAPRPVTSSGLWTEGRQALGLLGRDRLLRALAVAQALAALSTGATSALLVVLAVRHLDATGGGYGLMLAGIAVGAFLGPLLLTRRRSPASRPRIVFAAFGVRGLVDLVLAGVTALWAAVAALVVYGLGTSTGSVTFATLLQSHVPAEVRGRVFSAFDLIWQSMRLVSVLLGGLLADAVGIRAVFSVAGALLLAAALTGLATSGPAGPLGPGKSPERGPRSP